LSEKSVIVTAFKTTFSCLSNSTKKYYRVKCISLAQDVRNQKVIIELGVRQL